MLQSSILLRIAVFLCLALPFMAISQNSSGNLGGIPFSYSLSANAKTSAGVFKPDSTLVRTLWGNEQKNAGNYTSSWDGKDDAGNLMPDGNYQVRVLSNNVQYNWDGVVGNSSTSFSGTTVHHAQQTMMAMAQVGTTMYYGIGYNELGDVHGKFYISQPNEVRTTLKGGGMVIRYLATDGNKVYSAGQFSYFQNNQYNIFHAITALNPNPTGQDVLSTFSSGATTITGDFTYSTFGRVEQPTGLGDPAGIYGLAVQTSGNYLFAAYPNHDSLQVFNKTTGAFIRNNTIDSVREIAIQGENVLWAITGANTVAKYTINSNGTLTAATLMLPAFTEPLALSVSADGTKVAVADRGTTAHQVKIYNTSTGALVSIIGRNESYNNPTVYDNKFYFNNVKRFDESDYGQSHCFVKYQNDGSIWIGDYGNIRCQHFDANGTYIDNIQYMGFSYAAQVDINNPTRVFSGFLEFAVDYSKTLAPNNGSWRCIRNWAKNIQNPVPAAQHPMRSVATLSNGRTYAFYTKNNTVGFSLIELDTVTGARATGITFDGAYDMNSDGSKWQIGSNHIGQPTFWKRQPLTGFDGSNNPQWGAQVILETTPTVTASDPLTFDGYIRRNQITSSNIIASFSSDNPASNTGFGTGYHLGGFKNSKWLFKVSPSTHKDYGGEFPADGTYDIGNNVINAGSFMQAVDRNIFWGYIGEFWKGGQVNKYNHYYDDGLMVGQFGTTRYNAENEVGKELSYTYPGLAGNAVTGTYVKVGNDIYLYHADESYHTGVHRWKISGLNTIQEQTINIIKTGIPPPQVLNYIDLMAGLPFDTVVVNNTAGWTRFSAESPNFSMVSSRTTYKKSERDIRIFSIGQNVDCWVKRELGTNIGLSNWKITGELCYPEAGEYGDNFVEVLDANERIIIRISRPQTFPNLEIKANNSRIAYGPEVFSHVGHLQPLSIITNNNSITVNYADYTPVTVNPFDSTADPSKPTTLRFYTISQPSGHQVDAANLKFYKTTVSAPIVRHFRSKASGLWKNVTTWESSADSSTWVDATVIPDSSVNSITIRGGHTVAITDSANADQLTIQSSAALNISPNASFSINDGTGSDVTISSSGKMTIQSDSTGTGRISKSSGTVNGSVIVERFITAANNKAYRLLGPSVTTTGGSKPFIRDNWQEGQNNTSVLSNFDAFAAHGIHISGSMNGSNGFDATATGLASMFYYNQAATVQAWQPIPNTNATNFEVSKGYMIYIRGDRSTDLAMNMTSSNTTLRTTGIIATGTQTFASLESNGRNSLVTNPYPSPIDWNVLYNDATTSNAANFENFYTYLDPNIGLSGGYVTVTANGIKSVATNATTEIQSGQAFFIKAKTGITSPSFVVKENHKTSTTNLNVFRTGPREQFLTALYFSDANGVRIVADAVNSVYDTGFSTAVDKNDAEEIANWDENVAIMRAGKTLSIEGRPLIDLTDTIWLKVQHLRMQNYEWQFKPMDFPYSSLKAYLEDKYLNTRTQIDLWGTTVATFSVNANPGSSDSARFRIVFAPNSSLPVTIQSLKAYQKGLAIQVDWTVSQETNIDHYEIEKSTDGRQFAKVGSQLAQNAGSFSQLYMWLDQDPKEGNNFYRIKLIDKNGTISYSTIVNVKTGDKKGSLDVYPNPVTGNFLTVQLNNMARGSYTINVLNVMGQKIVTRVIDHPGGSASQSISLTNGLLPGSYNLQITGNGINFYQKFLKQ